jgi:hypothetical protein
MQISVNDGDFILFSSLFMALLYEIMNGIRDNDMTYYKRFGFDRIDPKERKVLKGLRDAVFHFPENINKSIEQEAAMKLFYNKSDKFFNWFEKILFYEDDLLENKEIEAFKEKLENKREPGSNVIFRNSFSLKIPNE